MTQTFHFIPEQEHFWAPPGAVRPDELFLLSIRTVIFAEWLSLITSNIIYTQGASTPSKGAWKTKTHQGRSSRLAAGMRKDFLRACVRGRYRVSQPNEERDEKNQGVLPQKKIINHVEFVRFHHRSASFLPLIRWVLMHPEHLLWAAILIRPSDPPWWNRSKTQFSARLVFLCQNLFAGQLCSSIPAGWSLTGITVSTFTLTAGLHVSF